MSIGKSRIIQPYKVQPIAMKRLQKNRLITHSRHYTFGDLEDEDLSLEKNNSFFDGRDNFKYRIKLLGGPNATISKDTLKFDEQASKKIEKKEEVLLDKLKQVQKENYILLKKSDLLEKTVEKLKQENHLLKKMAFTVYRDFICHLHKKVLENKNLDLTSLKKHFKKIFPSIDQKEEYFPVLQKYKLRNNKSAISGIQKEDLQDITSDSRPESNDRKRLGRLEDQNYRLVQKSGHKESVIENKSFDAISSKVKQNIRGNPYEGSDCEEDSQNIKTVLNQAMSKLKAIEHELEKYEQKNQVLELELKEQKKASEFNEDSYVKIVNNQAKLLEESLKLQKNYQEVLKNLSKVKNSSPALKN